MRLEFIRMMNHHKTFPELVVGFDMLWVGDDAVIDRADFLAGWNVIVSNAFGAEIRIDDIDLVTH